MFPFTPKSKRIFSRKEESLFSFLVKFSFSFFDGIFNKSKEGNLNVLLDF